MSKLDRLQKELNKRHKIAQVKAKKSGFSYVKSREKKHAMLVNKVKNLAP